MVAETPALSERSAIKPRAADAGSRSLRADEDEGKKKGGPKEFSALKYRLVGPPAGGRVARATGIPGDPLTYYAATASGGVWKSTDGGVRWKPLFEEMFTDKLSAGWNWIDEVPGSWQLVDGSLELKVLPVGSPGCSRQWPATSYSQPWYRQRKPPSSRRP